MEVKPDAKSRVTFKDIAHELGVAVSTVSNAYNRPKQLSPALRERVFETAKRLGYAGPNPAASGLRRGTTGVIGVAYSFPLAYVFTDPVAAIFIQGVAQEAEGAGLSLLLISGYSATPSQDVLNVTPASRASVDGFIVHAFADGDPLLEEILGRKLPTVLVDNPDVGGLPYVAVADEQGARAAATHVLELGHRRLGVVSLELDLHSKGGIINLERQERAAYQTTRARLQGYRAAVHAVGLSWEDVVVYESFDNTPEEGRKAAATLLEQATPPSAILTMSDQLALGVLEYASEKKIRVPSELSVVGYDDALSGQREPFLTTVHQPHVEKGRHAARLLIAQLRGEPVESVTLPTHLVVRRSTTEAET